MKTKKFVVSIAALALFISASIAFAIGDDQNSRPSLKGIRKLVLVVQIENPVSDDFRRAGLTEERIRTGIELKLREAKVDVVYLENLKNLPSDVPILHVEVNGSKRDSKVFSFLIEVELWQKSFLKRAPNIETMAATWSTGVFGLGSASTIANDMMRWVNGTMDAFVKALLSVNS